VNIQAAVKNRNGAFHLPLPLKGIRVRCIILREDGAA
jgi:hypothetical protein